MINKIITEKKLKNIRKKHKKIGFCSGCFDMFHSGHAFFLNQAKKISGTLVVGLGRDKTVKQLKGKKRPINPEANRLYVLSSLESVDYVILNEKNCSKNNIDFYNILNELRPNYLILNSDSGGIKEKKELCKKLKIKIKILKRAVPPPMEIISSTEIIKKIKTQK